MYYIKKRLEVSAAHNLSLSYESKCQNLHGHNWIIYVYCKSDKLNQEGMVVDFMHIKRDIQDKLDHQNLNEVLQFNPTAENIAKWIVDNLETCYKATVIESENNEATYEL